MGAETYHLGMLDSLCNQGEDPWQAVVLAESQENLEQAEEESISYVSSTLVNACRMEDCSLHQYFAC